MQSTYFWVVYTPMCYDDNRNYSTLLLIYIRRRIGCSKTSVEFIYYLSNSRPHDCSAGGKRFPGKSPSEQTLNCVFRLLPYRILYRMWPFAAVVKLLKELYFNCISWVELIYPTYTVFDLLLCRDH